MTWMRMMWSVALLATVSAGIALAQGQVEDAAPGSADETRDADDGAPSADEVMRGLLDVPEDPPAVDPAGEADVQPIPSRVGLPATQVDIDPAIVGVAPGQDPPPLRREGEFVIQRRGRVVRSPDGGYNLFVFEADSPDAQDPPMILQPCRLLEDIEDYVAEHGDRIVFIISGQVHTYRGANYLLPTVARIAIDKGNIQ